MNRCISFDVTDNVVKRRDGFNPVRGERNYTKLRFYFKSGYGWDNCEILTCSFFVSADQMTKSVPARFDSETGYAEFTIPGEYQTFSGRLFIAVQGTYEENGETVTVSSNIACVDVSKGLLVEEGAEQGLYESLMVLLNTFKNNVDDELDELENNKEDKINKVQSIGSQSQTGDNDKYPSVTAVRNYVNTKTDDLDDYIEGELDELDEAKVSKPSTSPNGTNGQLLRTKGDGTTEWVDVIDSTLSAQGAAAEAKTTGNYINVLTDRETALDGIVSQEWEIGMRYLVNGVETWSGTSTSRMSTKPGTYIRFNKDDLIVMKKTMDYQFLVVYSTDNGSTWTSTSNRDLYYSILEDSIGWICIKKASGTFTEEEMQSVVNNYFFILRKGTGEIKKNALLAEALSIASGSFDRSEIIDSKYGFTYQDAKTTDTVVLSYDLLLPEFEASKGDIFAIKVSILIDYPDMYSNIGVRIYERYNGNTVKTTDITDISDTIIYTVSNSNADAIHIKGLLLADEGDITTRHNEIFDYKISVVKKLPGEIEELLTEAGDIWEV